MGSMIGYRIDYNGVEFWRGQQQIPSKNWPKYPHGGQVLIKVGWIKTFQAFCQTVNASSIWSSRISVSLKITFSLSFPHSRNLIYNSKVCMFWHFSLLQGWVTETRTPRINYLISWVRKTNRAARATRSLVQFFDVVCQATFWRQREPAAAILSFFAFT